MSTSELRPAGTTIVQAQFRANIYQACKALRIKEGDTIEIWIKRVSKEDD